MSTGVLPHQVKVVIAGNHDLTFDDDLVNNRRDYLSRNFRINEDGMYKFNKMIHHYKNRAFHFGFN